MSEPMTALRGARFDGYVTVREDDARGMIQLRGDLASDALTDSVRLVTGAEMPDTLGMSRGKHADVAWMSPDELLILTPLEQTGAVLASLSDKLSGHHHLALDVTDMRTSIRLEGAKVREVLAKLTPVDMATLPVGMLRRTRLAQIAAGLWLSDETTAHVICFRSVGRYAFDALAISAKKGGEVFAD